METAIEQLVGHVVVLDVTTRYVYVGTLSGLDRHYLDLRDADVHDLRDTANTTRELYVLEAKRHGFHRNRKRVLVRREDVVSVSALDDVVE